VLDYGYHSEGETFLVHRRDIEALASWFAPAKAQDYGSDILSVPMEPPVTPEPPVALEEERVGVGVAPGAFEEPEQPALGAQEVLAEVDVAEAFDIQTIPGVTAILAKRLRAAGLDTLDLILSADVEGLERVRGIGSVRAASIVAAARDLLERPRLSEDEALAELEELLK